MARYFVTGDTHGMIDFAKLQIFAEINEGKLNKDDYVIILGDFGGVFFPETVERNLMKYQSLPFSIAFVDGNHENFDLLAEYPVSKWNGGNVQVLVPGVIHLMRGEIYDIEGHSVFTFGGADSIDKYDREPYRSWWPQEIPSYQEYSYAMDNLEKHGYKVEFILTHTCDLTTLHKHFYVDGKDLTSNMLSAIEKAVTYDHWYFGHHHMDFKIDDKKRCFYQDIIKLF